MGKVYCLSKRKSRTANPNGFWFPTKVYSLREMELQLLHPNHSGLWVQRNYVDQYLILQSHTVSHLACGNALCFGLEIRVQRRGGRKGERDVGRDRDGGGKEEEERKTERDRGREGGKRKKRGEETELWLLQEMMTKRGKSSDFWLCQREFCIVIMNPKVWPMAMYNIASLAKTRQVSHTVCLHKEKALAIPLLCLTMLFRNMIPLNCTASFNGSLSASQKYHYIPQILQNYSFLQDTLRSKCSEYKGLWIFIFKGT